MRGSLGSSNLKTLGLLFGLSLVPSISFAQKSNTLADVSPTFEVASVKVVARDASGSMPFGRIFADPVRIRFSHLSMLQLLTNAFEMQGDQFVGPKWAMSDDGPDRYEIDATNYRGAPMKQVHAMLLNLLKERFHLTYHMEKKNFDIYELVVAKKGPMLQAAEIAAELPTSIDHSIIATDADRYPVLPPGSPVGVGIGRNVRSYVQINNGFVHARRSDAGLDRGLLRFSFRTVTTTQLLTALQGLVVGITHGVDHTGLQGKYDVRLAFSPDPPNGTADADGPEPGPDIFSALENQLGLKLQKTKGPLDVVVIDHIDQMPVEN
jgi:uncharacterized protein (TIGR03435 family)